MNPLYRPDDRHHRNTSSSSRRERRANKRQLEKVKKEIKEDFEY